MKTKRFLWFIPVICLFTYIIGIEISSVLFPGTQRDARGDRLAHSFTLIFAFVNMIIGYILIPVIKYLYGKNIPLMLIFMLTVYIAPILFISNFLSHGDFGTSFIVFLSFHSCFYIPYFLLLYFVLKR
jgi:hypothetical protein